MGPYRLYWFHIVPIIDTNNQTNPTTCERVSVQASNKQKKTYPAQKLKKKDTDPIKKTDKPKKTQTN